MGNVHNSLRLRQPLLTDFDGTKIVDSNNFWDQCCDLLSTIFGPHTRKLRVQRIIGEIKIEYAFILSQADALEKSYLNAPEKTTRITMQRLFHLFQEVKLLKNTPYAMRLPPPRLKQSTRVAIFEGHLQSEIPADLIKKVFASEKVDTGDWNEFTARLKRSTLTVRELHKTLIALKNTLSPETPAEGIEQLEQKLFEAMPEFFAGPDPKQVAWRANLKTGDKIGDIELGSEFEASKHRVFEVVGRPDAVFVAAANCALLPLRLFYQKHFNSGLKCPECLFIDSKGRFALFERLPYPVKSLTWGKKITGEDKDLLTPFINLAKWCLEEQMLPSPLKVDDLYFDHDDTLRSVKLVALAPFDEEKLKNFLKELSKGNETVHKFLHAEVYHQQ